MYIITADDNIFHDSDGNDHEYLVLEGTLTKEFNKSGTLAFRVPYNNIGVKENWFKKLKTIIRVYKKVDTKWNFMWKGRILDTAKDFYGSMTYNCEGWMSVLCDSVVRPHNSQGTEISNKSPKQMFIDLINSHNSQMGDNNYKKFEIDTTGISDAPTYSSSSTYEIGDFVMYPSGTSAKLYKCVTKIETAEAWTLSHWAAVTFPCGSYETTLDYIQTNFLENDDIGGLMWLGIKIISGIEHEVLFYHPESSIPDAEQDIIFGENLLDLTEAIDAAEVYTVCIPKGKDDIDISTPAAINGGHDYVENETGVSLFGRIVRRVDFSDVTDKTALKKKAEEDLAKNIKEALTIDISAFDLALLYNEVPTFEVGTMVRVISPPHKFDNRELCRSVSVDLVNPANTRYTLGVDPRSMTKKQTAMSSRIEGNRRYVTEVVREMEKEFSTNMSWTAVEEDTVTDISELNGSLFIAVFYDDTASDSSGVFYFRKGYTTVYTIQEASNITITLSADSFAWTDSTESIPTCYLLH